MLRLTTRERMGVGVILCCAIIGVALFSWQERTRADRFLSAYDQAFQNAHQDIQALRELVMQNGVTVEVAEVVRDCEDRSRFEELLGTLETSTRAELLETKSLYYACSQYYPLRMQLMYMELHHALQQLTALHVVQEGYRSNAARAEVLVAWEEYLAHEKKRAELVRDQSLLQGLVIDALSADTDISPILQQVSEVNQLLSVSTKEMEVYGEALDRAWDAYAAP